MKVKKILSLSKLDGVLIVPKGENVILNINGPGSNHDL